MVMQDVNLQLFSDSVQGEAFLSLRRPNEKKHEWTDSEKNIVVEELKRLGLYGLKDRHPMSLSGGQKQRVAILDAVVSGKEIIVFDEPTSGLDFGHMREVSELLSELSMKGKLVIVITHDVELLVLGVIAEVILYTTKHSIKGIQISYMVFAFDSIGSFFTLFFARDTFLARCEQYYGAEYVETIDRLTPSWSLIVLAVIALIGAVIGGVIGRKMSSKHFEKAGII